MSAPILFSFAHPDDESFSGAGMAMKYAAAGSRIVLATATLGERGKLGNPPVCTSEALAACRERELREFFDRPNVDRILGIELWRQAWGPPLGRRPSDDVMEGLQVGGSTNGGVTARHG